MNDCITGGSGFIGRHLLSRLEPNTIQIHHQHIKTIYGSGIQCRNFYHLASYGNMAYQKDEREIWMANIWNSAYFLAWALRAKMPMKRFVYVSSSSVTLPSQTKYSKTKRIAEMMVEESGIPHCIVRPYTVTGVGEQDRHLIPTLIRSCFTGEEVRLVLHPTHDFIDVSDLVSGILALVQNNAQGTFSLGWGEAISNELVWKTVESVTGKKANVIPDESAAMSYDSECWKCSDFGARKYWEPKKPLWKSIEEMVESYRREHP